MIWHNWLASTHMIRTTRNMNTQTYHNDEHSPNCKRVASLDTFAIPQQETEVRLIEQKSLSITSRELAMVPPATQRMFETFPFIHTQNSSTDCTANI